MPALLNSRVTFCNSCFNAQGSIGCCAYTELYIFLFLHKTVSPCICVELMQRHIQGSVRIMPTLSLAAVSTQMVAYPLTCLIPMPTSLQPSPTTPDHIDRCRGSIARNGTCSECYGHRRMKQFLTFVWFICRDVIVGMPSPCPHCSRKRGLSLRA